MPLLISRWDELQRLRKHPLGLLLLCARTAGRDHLRVTGWRTRRIYPFTYADLQAGLWMHPRAIEHAAIVQSKSRIVIGTHNTIANRSLELAGPAETALVSNYDCSWALQIQPGHYALRYMDQVTSWYGAISASYEFQVPIVVLTHYPPRVAPKQDEHLTFRFVTDGVKSAVAHAKAGAGDKAVQVVGGVSIAQQLLGAGCRGHCKS